MTLNSANFDAFYIVAQEGHFTRAALRLSITQSALSQRIKNLEEELGITLFFRKKSGITLTEHGRELLRLYQTRQSIDLEFLEPLRGQKSTERSGVLRIGGFSSVMRSKVLPALAPLLLKNPKLQLKLVTKELYELKTCLNSGEIDYLLSYEKWLGDAIHSEKIGEEIEVLVQKKNQKGDLPILDHDEQDQTSLKYLGQKSAKNLRRHFLDDIYGIIEAVRMGLGRAVVPLHLIEHEKDIEIAPHQRQKVSPVYIHFFERPYYSKLHEEVLSAIAKNWLA